MRRSHRWWATAAVAAVAVAFAAGCGGGNTASSSGGGSGSTTNATAVAGNAANGVKLFQQNCSMCHSTGSNTVVGPGLANVFDKKTLPNGKAMNDQDVMDWIRTGGGGMPGFPQLSDQQRADLVAYLKTLH
ncbi:MAG: cytochrome c [Alicyclobacillus sp.]|nr:cytochrome c [Alicyclobacillus sp.]